MQKMSNDSLSIYILVKVRYLNCVIWVWCFWNQTEHNLWFMEINVHQVTTDH